MPARDWTESKASWEHLSRASATEGTSTKGRGGPLMGRLPLLEGTARECFKEDLGMLFDEGLSDLSRVLELAWWVSTALRASFVELSGLLDVACA